MHFKTILTSSTLQSNSTNRLPCSGDDGALSIYGSCLPWHRVKKAVWAAKGSSSKSYTQQQQGFSSLPTLPFCLSQALCYSEFQLSASQSFCTYYFDCSRGLCDSSSRIKQGKISISLCLKPPEILVEINKSAQEIVKGPLEVLIFLVLSAQCGLETLLALNP